jgi:hypothetical protein
LAGEWGVEDELRPPCSPAGGLLYAALLRARGEAAASAAAASGRVTGYSLAMLLQAFHWELPAGARLD